MKPGRQALRRSLFTLAAPLVVLLHAIPGAYGQVLEEIIVTAQKREQNVQDVGISLTAFSGDQIRSLGMTSASELGAITPGLMIWEFGNSPSVSVFTIRGVSQNDFADHNEVPNAMYSDGVYNSFVGAIGSQMYDVERIEVLRGPQGTLFGRNATGGLVQIINRRPTEVFEGYGDLTYAEQDQVKFEGALSGPLAKNLLGRMSVSTNRYDGFVKNRIGADAAEDEQYNGRLQLQWKPAETMTALLNLRGSRIDDINAGGYDIRAAAHDFSNDGLIDYVPPGVANPTCPLFFGINAPPGQTDCFGYTEPDDDPYTASFERGNLERSYFGSTLTVDWALAGADITWIVDGQWIEKSLREDTDATPIDVLKAFTDQASRQFSTELRASGEQGALRWTTGLYYLLISGDYTVGLDSSLFGAGIRNDYDLETNSEALFAQVEYKLSDVWSVIAGLRYTWDQKDFDFRPSCTGPGCFFFEAPGSSQVLGLSADQSESDYSAKLEIDWRPTDDLLVYAGVTRGTKAGGFSGPILALQTPDELPYEGEVLTDYEAGFKWMLPGGWARLNAGAFYYDYTDYQDYDTITLSQVITNKDAEVYGGEAELVASPLEGLDVSLGVSLLEATVFDIRLPAGRIADREMPQSPSVSLTGLLRKEWVFSSGYIALQGDFKYISSRYFRSINHPVFREDGYAVGNGRISFESLDRRWSVAVFVKNITDKEYRVLAFEDLNVNGVVNSNYGPPRWVGINGSLRW